MSRKAPGGKPRLTFPETLFSAASLTRRSFASPDWREPGSDTMARLRVPSVLLALAAALAGSSAGAQVTAEQAVNTAREVYGPALPSQSPEPCPEARPDEIVVCREIVEDDRYRVRSSTDDAIEAGAVVDDGLPRAPDLGPQALPIVVARGCFIPPCPKPPAYMIDFASIPEAPRGSDAARYVGESQTGEAPRETPADEAPTQP
jgi:hypothetical protein